MLFILDDIVTVVPRLSHDCLIVQRPCSTSCLQQIGAVNPGLAMFRTGRPPIPMEKRFELLMLQGDPDTRCQKHARSGLGDGYTSLVDLAQMGLVQGKAMTMSLSRYQPVRSRFRILDQEPPTAVLCCSPPRSRTGNGSLSTERRECRREPEAPPPGATASHILAACTLN